MGLISLYLILKSLEKLKFRNKALKKKRKAMIIVIMVDVVTDASEGQDFCKKILFQIL